MTARTLRLALLALACTVDLSWASGFTGKEGSRGESGEGDSSGSQEGSACWNPDRLASIFSDKGILSWLATVAVSMATGFSRALDTLSERALPQWEERPGCQGLRSRF